MAGPRIMIAATQSGTGKTSLSIALTRALVKRGLRVATFKAGPDFLDPTYLALASGRPCYNLDTWMMGRDYVASLLETKSRDADIALIEGVMGLFDGASSETLEGSSAEIADLTKTPVLLAVNAHGMSRSISALVEGYAGFHETVDIRGVIANHVGSAGHGDILSRALHTSGLPDLVAAVPRRAFPVLPSRHLGLVTADAEVLSKTVLDAFAEAMEKHGDVDRIIDIARGAGDLEGGSPRPPSPCPEKALRFAVAFDEAFHFYYQDTLDALGDVGFDVIRFSPLKDRAVPADVAGLYVGGGYPEVFSGPLSRNQSMITSVHAAVRSGIPVYAECGGLIYLSRSITDLKGETYPMCGVLPFGARMLDRRRSLGYVEVSLAADALWGPKGAAARGHEFHYSELGQEEGETGSMERIYRISRRRNGEVEEEGYRKGNVLASYIHLHLPSRPGAFRNLYTLCAGGG